MRTMLVTWVIMVIYLTLFSSHTTPAIATVLYSEDFSSGNAARVVWQEYPSPTNFNASSGDYVLTQPDGDTPVYAFVSDVPEIFSLTDTSVRAQVRLEGSSEGVALFARNKSGSGNVIYQGGFNSDKGALYLGWNNPDFNLFDGVAFDYDLNAEDLVLQLDVIGNELTMWAWRPGDGMPAQPQLRFMDDSALATFGKPGILGDFSSPGTASTAIFRYVIVADTHIPGPSADFDGDGDVDGTDFLTWQRGQVTNPPTSEDLTLWQEQFGNTSTPSSSNAIPEPSTLLLSLLGIAAIGMSCRHNSSRR